MGVLVKNKPPRPCLNCGALFHPSAAVRSFCRSCQRIKQKKGPGRAYNQGEYRRNRQILLKNAIYYIRAAGKGDIRIWLEKADDYNILHFKDTGMGMTQESLANAFVQFYTSRSNGSGLGLSFCKSVMVGHNGDISVESEESEFTHFQLQFPKSERVTKSSAKA